MVTNISRLVFNSFGVNTYILSDSNGKCLIIDPACSGAQEENRLATFISDNKLEPIGMINTHFHIDHILGNTFVCDTYNLRPQCHDQSRLLWESASEYGLVFGFKIENLITPADFLNEGDTLNFGNSEVHILYTPGHADGSICLVNHTDRYVISGDVLFRDSIGRTDLPGGNYDTLHESISSKLFTLPDDYKVHPGHGPETTIGYEKINNPFL
jgi:glyoxylase-like metal-dependent hydrolase (beta-lactamase superfamily II)